MNNRNIRIVEKKILLIVHKPQPYVLWQVNGTRLGLRFSAKLWLFLKKIVRNFYVAVHIEGFIELSFSSRIDVTMP